MKKLINIPDEGKILENLKIKAIKSGKSLTKYIEELLINDAKN